MTFWVRIQRMRNRWTLQSLLTKHYERYWISESACPSSSGGRIPGWQCGVQPVGRICRKHCGQLGCLDGNCAATKWKRFHITHGMTSTIGRPRFVTISGFCVCSTRSISPRHRAMSLGTALQIHRGCEHDSGEFICRNAGGGFDYFNVRESRRFQVSEHTQMKATP